MPEDPYGRTPFKHPALEGLDALTEVALFDVLDRKRLAAFAGRVGLTSVIRWLPKKVGAPYGLDLECFYHV